MGPSLDNSLKVAQTAKVVYNPPLMEPINHSPAIAPLFIAGSPRSGTTVVMRAIESLDGFYAPHVEGHLMYWLLEGVGKVLAEPARYSQIFLPTSICTGDNLEKLLAWLRLAIDGFEKEIAGDRAQGRWIDKTPDIAQIRVLPVLQRLFPASQIIFMYRHPRDVVFSTRQVWDPNVSDRELLKRWVDLHQEYRTKIKTELDLNRVLELQQEKIVSDPEDAARQIAAFLGLDEARSLALRDFFQANRINRLAKFQFDSFDYSQKISPQFSKLVKKICKEEMKHWGYTDQGIPPISANGPSSQPQAISAGVKYEGEVTASSRQAADHQAFYLKMIREQQEIIAQQQARLAKIEKNFFFRVFKHIHLI